MVPAMGELISPATSSLERFTENVRRFSWFRFQSSLASPVKPSVLGPRAKSSTPEGVASPACTKPGICARSMFTPRVSSRTSNEPKKNALSETIGPPRVPPHCWRSRVGGSCPSTFDESSESSRKKPKALPENSIRARAGDDVDDASLGAAELRLVAGGDDLELLDRILGEPLERPAVQRIVVVAAVHDVRDRRAPLAENRDLLPLLVRREGFRPRHERDEILEVPAVERQERRWSGFPRAKLRSARVGSTRGRRRRDLDRLGDRGDVERRVERALPGSPRRGLPSRLSVLNPASSTRTV